MTAAFFFSSFSLSLFFFVANAAPTSLYDYDVLVYGASSAGVAAAIMASANGTRPVALVDPLAVAGGMLSAGGLYLTDQLDTSLSEFFVSGIAREWADRVRALYNATSDVLTPDGFIAQAAVDAMLSSRGSIRVFCGCALLGASMGGRGTGTGSAALALVSLDCGGVPTNLSAAVFIDASYSADLLVASGVPYTYGREAAGQYNESLGGTLPLGGGDGENAFPANISARAANGSLLPGISGTPLPPAGGADGGLMAYGHRACVTTDAATRISPFPAPAGYDRGDFALLQEVLDADAARGHVSTLSDFVALIPYSSSVAKAGRHKFMLCCGGWPINGDAVTTNEGYVGPAATAATRRALDASHTRYLLGALHYLATDAAVPAATRASAGAYGLCGDEWVSADPPHWPPQLYVREGARLVNDAVLTQASLVAPRGKADGVAVGAWYFDKHVVTRVADAKGWAANEGHFRASTTVGGGGGGEPSNETWCSQRPDHCANASAEWYDIPLSALLPRSEDATNLIVPVGLAASSVAFSSTRIESMLMGTGAAAGVVARLAVAAGTPVQDVLVQDVQQTLISEIGAVVHGPPVRSRLLNPHREMA